MITEPGVYDLADAEYHADPVPGGSLSSTGVRKLLPPSCPALFRHWADHGSAPKAEFDFGHAAHRLVLGTGPEIVVVDAKDWRTKAAQEQRDAAYAANAAPVLRAEYDDAQAMAAALRAHPVARLLFDSDTGVSEQAMFWVDGPSGIWCRSLPDRRLDQRGGRLILVDYKTTNSAAPDAISKAVYNHGYHQQAAWYLDAVPALGLAGDAAFLFAFQEKTAPYLVHVIELDAVALRIGRELNRRAIEVYALCTAAGTWPGYSTDIDLIALPGWAEHRHSEEYT